MMELSSTSPLVSPREIRKAFSATVTSAGLWCDAGAVRRPQGEQNGILPASDDVMDRRHAGRAFRSVEAVSAAARCLRGVDGEMSMTKRTAIGGLGGAKGDS